MFINRPTGGYDRDGGQHAQGEFLLLFSGASCRPLFAAVRSVRLRQLGHFMMGSAQIGGAKITVSGSYGPDGLPGDLAELPEAVRDTLVQVPDELYDAWNTGGGHNSAGSEAPQMRRWAQANLQALKKAGRAPAKRATEEEKDRVGD